MRNSCNSCNLYDATNASSFERNKQKENPLPFFCSSSLSSVDKNGVTHSIDTSETDKAAVFAQNYKYWDFETRFMSVNIFENAHFDEIVKMGRDAVPYILKELKKEPSQLVHALDLIYPGVMKYEGFVSLKDACEKWISILN